MNKYWIDREKETIKRHDKDIKRIELEMEKYYKKALNNVEKEINHLISKYANDNNFSYQDALKNLKNDELKDFRFEVNDYLDKIKDSGDKKLQLELNTLSTKAQITRLESMEFQLTKALGELSGEVEDTLDSFLVGTIKVEQTHNLFNISRHVGFAVSMASIDNSFIKEVLELRWSGKNFSERIWNNRALLTEKLKEEIIMMLVQGKSLNKASKDLSINAITSKKIETSFKRHLQNCKTLVQTEHNYVCQKVSEFTYLDLDIKKYQILATLDNRTSPICQEQDLQIYDTKELTVGTNCPPFHPRCRTTTIPYIKDNDSVRFARDKNKKRIKVDGDMDYKTYKELYLD